MRRGSAGKFYAGFSDFLVGQEPDEGFVVEVDDLIRRSFLSEISASPAITERSACLSSRDGRGATRPT